MKENNLSIENGAFHAGLAGSIRSCLNLNLKTFSRLLLIVVCLLSTVAGYSVDWKAQWIWQGQDAVENNWMSFRKEVTLSSIPSTAIANISVDSKYWLWVNGEMVKFEGGAARANTWYEEVDLKPFLKTGKNTIAILVWHWGRSTPVKGYHINSGKGGLLFQADLGSKQVVSDNTWKAKRHTGYEVINGADGGNNRLAQFNVYFNANKALGDWSNAAWYNEGYNDSAWGNANQKGKVPTAPWGTPVLLTVPLTNHGLSDYVSLKNGSTTITLPYKNTTGRDVKIIAKLPFNKQVTPYLDVECSANKVINIQIEKFEDEGYFNSYYSSKYTSKTGRQQFESYNWLNGHAMEYTIPAGVTVHALKYRWTGIGQLNSKFECDDPFFERLWWMGRNTLYVNARDNFMDCPDRERSLWIGDVADQASYLFYTMDEDGRQLLKKAIDIVVDFSPDGNSISGQVPGRVNELPTQSLQFVTQGIWHYYYNTGDEQTLQKAYGLVKNYLNLWGFDNNKGLIRMKSCTVEKCWDWVDWDLEGNSIDKIPVFNALYYYALLSARKMAVALNKPKSDIDWYSNRIDRLKVGFNKEYWKGKFYSSNASNFQDDRVNALAILSGLADESKHASIVNNVLKTNYFCSPHYEWMIDEAMCMAGYPKEALDRMKERYAPQVNSEITTLNEYFELNKGTMNHAWNAPNTILSKYIVGIEPTDVGWSKFSVLPNMVNFSSVSQNLSSVKGDISVSINSSANTFQMNLVSPSGTKAMVGVPKATISPSAITINGETVWENGNHISGISFISDQGENNDYIWVEVDAGSWEVIASTVINQSPFAGVISIPGTIEAENFDNGGQGVSYYDTEPENKSGEYRLNEGVDIGTTPTGGYSVGYSANNEWMEYTIDVSEDGLYDLEFHVSSKNGGGELSLSIDGEKVLGTTSVPSTTDWNMYEVFTEQVTLLKGVHVLRFDIVKTGFNIDKIVAKKANITGDDDSVFGTEISIYPNPNETGLFRLSRSEEWEVYSIQGVYLTQGKGDKVDLSNQGKGIYFLRINGGNKKVIVR